MTKFHLLLINRRAAHTARPLALSLLFSSAGLLGTKSACAAARFPATQHT